MAKQTIGIGAAPNDGTGDTARVAFDKCNDNFTELYDADTAHDGDIGSLDGRVTALEGAPSGVAELNDVGDVNAPTPADGDVLTWDATPGEWVPVAPTGGGGGATDLDDLTDVDTTTTPPTTGDVLEFDGTNWVPAAPSGGGSGALTYLATHTLAAVTSVDIEDFAGLSNKGKVILEIEYLTFSNDSAGLTMQFKLNGSYKSSGYKWNRYMMFTATTASTAGSASDTSIGLILAGAGGSGNASGEGVSGTINLPNPYDTVGWKRTVYDFAHVDDQAAQRLVQSRGAGTYGSTDAANALGGIRLAPSGGTMSGKIHVYVVATA